MTTSERSWFWPVQICCWLLIGFFNWLAQYSSGSFKSLHLYLNLAGLVLGGLIITSVYRVYFKKHKANLKINAAKLIAFLFASAIIQASGWLLILLLMLLPFDEGRAIHFTAILYNIIPLTGIMLAWDLAYVGYYLIRRYHLTEVEKWQLEAEMRNAQLGALRSQVNPHFLFNALNNIRALILEDQHLARQMITKFAEIFRYTLQHAEGKEVKLADELYVLKQYLELLKIQYEDKLTYTIQAGEDCLNALIPPMILQLLVENAVKHGIALQTTGGLINVNIYKTTTALTLIVNNTGTLNHKNTLEDSLGIGLNNVRQRLKLLYGEKANLTIEDQRNLVTVTINIKYD